MIVRHLLAALAAGIVAGILVTVIQQMKVVPLILEAERYETATAHDHGALDRRDAWSFGLISPAHAHGTQTEPHDHPEEQPGAQAQPASTDSHAEEPGAAEGGMLFGDNRLVNTLMANLVTGGGFALIMAAISLLSGVDVTLRNGVLWGAAGWLSFQMLPALGLPPELPGFPAGDLQARQIWWLATAAASAAGLYWLAIRTEAWGKALGVALLAAPQIIGAPRPPSLDSAVPAVLAAEYAVAALASGLFFWVVLGLVMGAINDRFARTA